MTPETPASGATEQTAEEKSVVAAETKPKPAKKSTSGFSIVKLEKRVTATFSIMAKAFVIILIAIAMVFITRELSESGYVITQVNVPPSFEEAGYTGPVVAKRISENLTRIINRTSMQAMAEGYSVTGDENDVSVDMVGLGVPVRGVVDLIGDALGVSRKKKIVADITLEGDNVVLVIKVGSETPERSETPLNANIGIPVKAVVTNASETIFKYTNDRVLGSYFGNITLEYEKNISLAKYQLEKYKNDPAREALAYARWGGSLVSLGKLEAADAKLKQALALDSTQAPIYTSRARYYFALRDYKKALEYAKKSYACLPKNPPDYLLFTAFLNLGYFYSFNNQSDSAIAYYHKALAVDPKGALAYFNLSYEYLIKGDTTQCLDLVEKALANDLGVATVKQDADMAPLMNHPRVKEMLLKYEE